MTNAPTTRHARLERKSFTNPDATRAPDKTIVELLALGGTEIGRYTFEPGWKWSECIKPVVGTESCRTEHLGYCIAGTLHCALDDGTELDIAAGDAYFIPAGHDGWVVGDEPAVLIEFNGASGYARPPS